ncbi:MAG: cytochrome c [Porphyrobacter sp.]|nr:cytochrome c [Porphyrobacter sp.]
MKHAPLLAIIALALAGCGRGSEVTFADAAITLPEDSLDLPQAPGRDAVLANCTACHSPSMMLQQPKLARDKWAGIVTKMREVYKAPVDEAAVPEILDYLVAVQAQAEEPAAREGA